MGERKLALFYFFKPVIINSEDFALVALFYARYSTEPTIFVGSGAALWPSSEHEGWKSFPFPKTAKALCTR
jgi:hypothetical protein